RPAESDRIFSVGMTDDHELLFAAALASRLRREAPRARLVVRAVDIHSRVGALDDGTLDVTLGAVLDERLPSWHERTVLFREGYSCVWSTKQFRLKGRLSLDRYLALEHVLVTFGGDLSGRVDEVLAVRGKRRRVVLGVPRFGGLPTILASM